MVARRALAVMESAGGVAVKDIEVKVTIMMPEAMDFDRAAAIVREQAEKQIREHFAPTLTRLALLEAEVARLRGAGVVIRVYDAKIRGEWVEFDCLDAAEEAARHGEIERATLGLLRGIFRCVGSRAVLVIPSRGGFDYPGAMAIE